MRLLDLLRAQARNPPCVACRLPSATCWTSAALSFGSMHMGLLLQEQRNALHLCSTKSCAVSVTSACQLRQREQVCLLIMSVHKERVGMQVKYRAARQYAHAARQAAGHADGGAAFQDRAYQVTLSSQKGLTEDPWPSCYDDVGSRTDPV